MILHYMDDYFPCQICQDLLLPVRLFGATGRNFSGEFISYLDQAYSCDVILVKKCNRLA